MVMLYLIFDYRKHFFFYSEYSHLCTDNHRVLSSISLDSPGTMYLKNSTIYLKNMSSTHDLHRASLKLMRWLPDYEMKGENIAEGYYFIYMMYIEYYIWYITCYI